MLRKKRILCSMLAVMTLLCNMPVPVQAAEGVLQTEVLAVREEDGQVTAVYDTKEGRHLTKSFTLSQKMVSLCGTL